MGEVLDADVDHDIDIHITVDIHRIAINSTWALTSTALMSRRPLVNCNNHNNHNNIRQADVETFRHKGIRTHGRPDIPKSG